MFKMQIFLLKLYDKKRKILMACLNKTIKPNILANNRISILQNMNYVMIKWPKFEISEQLQGLENSLNLTY